MSIEDSIQVRYDEFVLAAGGAVSMAEAKSAIRLDVARDLEEEERDYEAEADLRIDRQVSRTRDRRRDRLRRDMEHFLDAFTEDGTYLDPILSWAFPLGDERGTDKSLRYWTAEDFSNSVKTVRRQAEEVTAAADRWEDTCHRVIELMAQAGAVTLGDLPQFGQQVAA